MTFPRLLHDAGYEAGYIGKWHMGNDASPRPGFDLCLGMPGQGASNDPELNDNGQPHYLELQGMDELYDLEADPHEMTNVIDAARTRDVRDERGRTSRPQQAAPAKASLRAPDQALQRLAHVAGTPRARAGAAGIESEAVRTADASVAIVGAGPTGIACSAELSRQGIAAVCYEKGFLLDSIYHFPEEMRWFSTRDLLDIAGVPFASPEAHPSRLETLAYYRSVAERFAVRVEPETEVRAIRAREGGGFEIEAVARGKPHRIAAPEAILATGFFHNPRRLGVPGEDLPHVHRRYVSGYPFHGRAVVVVGGKNSAAEAALDLYRHGARVTLVVRGPALSERVKYWIKPDLENRIRAGEIRAHFSASVGEIAPGCVWITTAGGAQSVSADAVFPLIGYEPDFALFERCGIRLEGERRVPAHDPQTLESNVADLYLAGAILGGSAIGRIFIENSRHHAGRIASAIGRKRRADR